MAGTDPEHVMADAAAALVAGVERLGAGWVAESVRRVLDASATLDPAARDRALAEAGVAGEQAAARVAAELRALFAHAPADQRATPLEIVRSLRREATAVLARAGVPPVRRDPYDARAFPDDTYGIVLRHVHELGDESLGGALLAWGLAKARALRPGGAAPGEAGRAP